MSVAPAARLTARVTFTNCSGMVWTPAGFSLVPVDPAEGAAWGVHGMALPVEVPDGAEITLAFGIQAPAVSGRYPARWAISREGVEVFQDHTPEQDVQVLVPADCAQPGPPVRFRTQVPPPDFVGVGRPVHASVTFANCGTEVLSRSDGWRLASRADPDDTWGARGVDLPADVPSGAEVTIPLDVVAPGHPGRYGFSWQVAHGDALVGEPSPRVEPTVLAPADCANAATPARFVDQAAPPGTLNPGQGADVRVTFANCGTRVWDGGYRLDSAVPDGGRTWSVDPVGLPLSVGPGFQIDVPFRVQAPVAPGVYPYRWAITAPAGALDEPSAALSLTVRCLPRCGDHTCGDDGCGGSCGGCSPGWNCDGAHCQAPDRPVCGELQWWNTYITYAHVVSGWQDTDLGVRANTQVQLRHTSRLEHTGVYGWGYMPEFTDLVTGVRFRFLHLRPSSQWATSVGRVYPAGYVVGLSGGDTYDTGYPTYSTGPHLCVQTLVPYRAAFPGGSDACR